MASTKVQERPAAEPAAGTYETDFYTWTIDQAAALRDGRLSELDIGNLAEEIEDLGKEVFSKLRSSFRIILLHMLKWDHQPERRSRSWAVSVETHRIDIEDVLADNPSLRRRQLEAIAGAYRKARLEAAGETGLRRNAFPTECPYTLDEILNRPFDWPDA